MAAFAYTDAYLEINTVDLSSFVRSVTLTENGTPVSVTAMGDDSEVFVGGVKNGAINVEFNQDYAASAVDATLNALLNTVTAFVFRPTSAAVSTTNPQRAGNVFIESLEHGGTHGDAGTMSVSWPTSGDITRTVA